MSNWSTIERLLRRARALGFDLIAVARVQRPNTGDAYLDWLRRGYHADMGYLARTEALEKRLQPEQVLPGARSVVAVAVNYHTHLAPTAWRDDPSRGIFASYNWGSDYHEYLSKQLTSLAEYLSAELAERISWRACVDTSPVLERDLAASAGLGFIGKNTSLIHPRLGSWTVLGELFVSAELSPGYCFLDEEPRPSAAPSRGTCGGCERCLKACPTGALVAPYCLDARRCISYLTIELKGAIPENLRPALGNRVFGCDVCQEVCPWNRRFARPTVAPAFQPRPDAMAPELLELMALDDAAFRARFGGSPVSRAKRRGLLRNVAVALGNWADPSAVPTLARALSDTEPLIRIHSAWALGRIASHPARLALRRALAEESDESVQTAIRRALDGATPGRGPDCAP